MIRSFFESNAFLEQRNRDLQIELCCLCKVSAMFLKMASSLEIQIANEFLNPGFGNAEIMDFGRLSDLEPVCFGARTMPSKKHAHFRGIWNIPATAATLPVPSLKLTACPWKMLPERKWSAAVSSHHQCFRAELLLSRECILLSVPAPHFFSPYGLVDLLVSGSRFAPQLRWGGRFSNQGRVEMGFLSCDPTKKKETKNTHLNLSSS